MAEKFWTHLKLKNGDQVKFVPPAPNGDRLGGVTQEERERIADVSNIKTEIANVTTLLIAVRDALKDGKIDDAINLLDTFLLDKGVLA